APLTYWGIYGIGQYGIALFILTPLVIGVNSTLLYGYKGQITQRQAVSNYNYIAILISITKLSKEICFNTELSYSLTNTIQ
ncbi:MAG TPA: hypothetical protein VN922_02840, partial [Bacteroidia bacterium]|nr:hypothetical protein [Bacteroidia bacterium]